LIVEPQALIDDQKRRIAEGLKLDILGFAFIATALGMLEITMDRGEQDDWFSSPMICAAAIIAVISAIAFLIREFTVKDPLLNLRLFKQRNYAMANLVILVVGVILFGTIQFLPQLLQQVLGYTATNTGLAMTAGGAVTLIVMPLSGILSNKVQPRYLLALGLAIEAFALWRLTGISDQVSFGYAAGMRVFIAMGIPFLFVPLSNAAYVGLPPDQSSQASAMMSISRNLGGSIGISLVQTFLVHRQQFHQSRMVEGLNPLNPNYTQHMNEITATITAQGQPAARASQIAVGQLYGQVMKESALISYIDVFWLLTIIVGLVAPMVFLLKTSPSGKSPGGAAA
jgi:DHA2 family multidrug resistance protein